MTDTVTMKKEEAEFIGKQFNLMSSEIERLREENGKLKEKLEPKDLQEVLGVSDEVINNIRTIVLKDNN